MTNLEAMHYLEYDLDDKCRGCNQMSFEEGYGFGCRGCKASKTIKFALNAISEREKYKWHDIVKDPKDLPKNRFALCIIAFKDVDGMYGHFINFADYRNGEFYYQDGDPVEKDRVFAWKYPYPFKEEEENE